jgi:nucleotide-binding universal stress UspA family protein
LANLKRAIHEVKPGVPFVKIVRYARENAVDLVVMGASGSSELDKMTFGSTVENVARRAHCHVMAIRNQEMAFMLPG